MMAGAEAMALINSPPDPLWARVGGGGAGSSEGGQSGKKCSPISVIGGILAGMAACGAVAYLLHIADGHSPKAGRAAIVDAGEGTPTESGTETGPWPGGPDAGRREGGTPGYGEDAGLDAGYSLGRRAPPKPEPVAETPQERQPSSSEEEEREGAEPAQPPQKKASKNEPEAECACPSGRRVFRRAGKKCDDDSCIKCGYEPPPREEIFKPSNYRFLSLEGRYNYELTPAGSMMLWGIRERDPEIMEAAIACGFNVNLPHYKGTFTGYDPYGIKEGESEQAYKWTMMMEAAAAGYLEGIKFLRRHGAHINTENEKGENALLIALNKGEMEVASFLRSIGGNLIPKVQIGDKDAPFAYPNPPLPNFRDIEAIKRYVARNEVIIRIRNKAMESPNPRAFLGRHGIYPAKPPRLNPNRANPLVTFIGSGNLDALKFALETRGASPNASRAHGEGSPVRAAEKAGDSEALELLYEHGARKIPKQD
jgi:hypothetical protein